ncbi:MAG: glycosyltransferase family 2 protein [Gammaproteobacteria bacterium]|nr:glycosyltransferase family 2 protein [Gammaproteobacteria bacterium]MDH5801756.1 glycosyltransferase family 2 protein [Gammaproteobacteria bacterium]
MNTNAYTGISVILPNYNGKPLLQENLPSLFKALELSDAAYEVIVVDDCSQDDSVVFLEQDYPTIQVIRSQQNSGFSHTCNTGIQAAKFDFSCIVNTDVTFETTYFQKALPYFQNNQVFAVKGSIINYKGSKDQVLNIENNARLFYKRGFLRLDRNKQRDKTDFDIQFSLLGCCFICRTDILKQLKGYDEIFSPYYWEDSDLPLRAIALGYEVIYASECIVYHKISSTIASHASDRKRQLISRRNKFLFTWKHLQGHKRWCQHILVVTMFVAFRWLILDWKFYTSLIMALQRKISA